MFYLRRICHALENIASSLRSLNRESMQQTDLVMNHQRLVEIHLGLRKEEELTIDPNS